MRSISFEEFFPMWHNKIIYPSWEVYGKNDPIRTTQRLVGECRSCKNGVRSLETSRLDDDGSRDQAITEYSEFNIQWKDPAVVL